jgi:TPP-dependent pyruvate/acetoin dehydrogenase alpha subunit
VARATAEELRELYFFMRLAREWDWRFERLVRLGAVSKWYSSVGNEATTVAAATAIEAGDALATLHRDSGAILRYYLDPARLFPDVFSPLEGRKLACSDPRDLLYRLACQMLGKRDGFTSGLERSYHYSLLREEDGILHLGMISHLGAMIPVAAGVALALKQRGSDRVVINFIGDGGTSTGDFHEGLNMAAVLRVPLVLIIENNGYAFSTPASEQYAAANLADRGAAYGIPGVRVDGNDPLEVLDRVSTAVARARKGGGPTLVEARLGRMRGHSEGDDSLQLLPEDERKRYEEEDPLLRFEEKLLTKKVVTRAYLDDITGRCSQLLLEIVDRALASKDPDPADATRGLDAR